MEQKEKFLDKLENEAIEMLDNFKKHPIKSMIVVIFILCGVKKIKEMLR